MYPDPYKNKDLDPVTSVWRQNIDENYPQQKSLVIGLKNPKALESKVNLRPESQNKLN